MWSRARAGFGILLLVVGELAFCVPALAMTAADSTTMDLVRQFDHPMGSQVAKYDGRTALAQATPTGIPGMDVSGWQGNVDWAKAWRAGAKFAYVKATEGTNYQNPYFDQQYDGSYQVGMIRGAYHFAHPDSSSGTDQANFFLAHGGGWSRDGKTLPGALDLEWNPSGDACYGLSPDAMVAWVKAFSDQYHAKTGAWPMLYTATSWWAKCTGNKGDFTVTSPIWVARYADAVGGLPYKWDYYTFWQYANVGTFPGDQNVFNGSYQQLQTIARG